MFRLCFLFKATFQMADLTHLCKMLPEIAAQIVVLNNDGRSVRYISQQLNIPRSTVQDALSRFRETHGFTRRPDLTIAGQQLIEMIVFCVFLYCEIGDCH
jgi:transposase-like protein